MSLSQSFSQKIGNVRPLNPCPSLDIDFANGGYVNTGGFANQESVGSANFKIGAFNGPDPIFTRATAATFRGSNGLIQYAPENLLQRSEEFNDVIWSKTGLLAFGSGSIANAAIAPDGTNTADLIVEDTSTGAHQVLQQSGTYTSSVTHSVYLKEYSTGAKRYGVLQSNTSNNQPNGIVVDLATGVITQQIIYSNFIQDISVTNVGNGWWRVSFVSLNINGNVSMRFIVSMTDTPTGNSFVAAIVGKSYQGNGTSGIYIWGAQLERSSTARPYISTTTTARYGPRFEYDLSGNPLGLLMEEQSQNLLQRSEEFNLSPWSSLYATISQNLSTAPDGRLTADKLIEANTTNLQGIWQDPTSTLGAYTLSVYAKSAERDHIQISLHNGASNYAYAKFNLAIGNVVISGASGTSSLTSTSMVSAGNGWYRVSVTATGVLGKMQISVATAVSSVSSYGYASYTGNGTSGIYIWGAQVEQKPFATSYIPTVGGPMTRNADVVNSTIGSWFNQSEGTIVVSGDRSHSPSLNASLYDSFYEFGDGGGGYHSAHFSDGTAEEFFGDNGAYATSAVGITTIGTFTGIASSYSSNDIYTTRDGITPNSAASATFVATPTTLNIGYSQAVTQAWNGHIKTFRYYPKALPDKLQRLSS